MRSIDGEVICLGIGQQIIVRMTFDPIFTSDLQNSKF